MVPKTQENCCFVGKGNDDVKNSKTLAISLEKSYLAAYFCPQRSEYCAAN